MTLSLFPNLEIFKFTFFPAHSLVYNSGKFFISICICFISTIILGFCIRGRPTVYSQNILPQYTLCSISPTRQLFLKFHCKLRFEETNIKQGLSSLTCRDSVFLIPEIMKLGEYIEAVTSTLSPTVRDTETETESLSWKNREKCKHLALGDIRKVLLTYCPLNGGRGLCNEG